MNDREARERLEMLFRTIGCAPELGAFQAAFEKREKELGSLASEPEGLATSLAHVLLLSELDLKSANDVGLPTEEFFARVYAALPDIFIGSVLRFFRSPDVSHEVAFKTGLINYAFEVENEEAVTRRLSGGMSRIQAHRLVGKLLLEAIQEDSEAAGVFQASFEKRDVSLDHEASEDAELARALSYALVSASVSEPGEVVRRQPTHDFVDRIAASVGDISPGAALTFLREAAGKGFTDDQTGLRERIKEALRNYARLAEKEKIHTRK